MVDSSSDEAYGWGRREVGFTFCNTNSVATGNTSITHGSINSSITEQYKEPHYLI